MFPAMFICGFKLPVVLLLLLLMGKSILYHSTAVKNHTLFHHNSMNVNATYKYKYTLVFSVEMRLFPRQKLEAEDRNIESNAIVATSNLKPHAIGPQGCEGVGQLLFNYLTRGSC